VIGTHTVEDPAKMSPHESVSMMMATTVIQKILASCDDTKQSWRSCGGFFRVFTILPFITKGKAFFDVIHQGSMPCSCFDPLSHNLQPRPLQYMVMDAILDFINGSAATHCSWKSPSTLPICLLYTYSKPLLRSKFISSAHGK
jgi:hypothetical protein